MANNIKQNLLNLEINIPKLVTGLMLILSSVISLFATKKSNKFTKASCISIGAAGVALLISELEDNFKPEEIEEMFEEF